MFTGLIQAIGRVSEIRRSEGGAVLSIAWPHSVEKPAVTDYMHGESIAIDGACLSVVAYDKNRFTVDLSQETWERSTLKDLKVGSLVHLERALRVGDRLGGHWVSGHVDGVAELLEKKPLGKAVALRFALPAELKVFLVSKGSIAIDGVSLTVNEVDDHSFTIALVPVSQRDTRLLDKKVGELFNLETDLLAKYVLRALQVGPSKDWATNGAHAAPSMDIDFLKRNGFA